jgi:hypothetical protein
MAAALPSSPSELKHLEKQILKEAKVEANQVKHTLKDVDATEKAVAKAQKVLAKFYLLYLRLTRTQSVNKAEKQNEKLSKKEAAAAQALNKAAHRHDSISTDLNSSERELKVLDCTVVAHAFLT